MPEIFTSQKNILLLKRDLCSSFLRF